LKKGSTVAVVTPFNEKTGEVDIAGLRKLLKFHVAQGTDNLCILGTTGEANVLSMAERKLILTAAVEEVKGKMPILAGTGTINPNQVKDMTLQAIDLGCDAALVVTPYYVKPPQRCLIKHMETAASYGLPVIIYNVPGRTAVDMTDASIAIAAQHPNVVGVKDATGKVERVAALLAELEKNKVKDFLMYSGDDGTSIDYVLAGGSGCISVTANVAAKAMHDLITACRAGDAALAKSINDPLTLLHKKLFVEANPIPAKWAVKRIGLIESAWARPPLDEMDPKFIPDVEEALKYAGLI
jgi:4-hydroxy-tetrahydrodipicolinate synthase